MKKNIYKVRLFISWIVIITAIFAAAGFYPFKVLDFQFSPLFQRLIFDFSVTACVLFCLMILLTLLFGRFYCSIICPYGILQEFISLVSNIKGKRKNKVQGNFKTKYLISALTFGAIFGGSALFIRYIDPYTVFSSTFSLSLFGIIFTFFIAILVFFKNRFFCTNICPVGAILGLVSKISLNKIYMDENCVHCGICSNNCPSGCINHKEKEVNNETCIKCLKCMSVCPKGAIKYGVKKVKFNPKRRDFIYLTGAIALIGAGYAAGINFTKKIADKVRNIILPAGADNVKKMANKCLNCNLCINNCPNKILSKANKDFSAVHIDYTKGKGYCKFDCNECSKVCPSGAIRKITLEEKQNTRIAMALIEGCVGCSNCVKECPVNAITMTDNKAVVDGTKCIGCGKCKTVCKADAVKIFSINEQSRV